MTAQGSWRWDIPTLSRGDLDRSEDLRDPDVVAAAWPTARMMRVGPHGEFAVRDADRAAGIVYEPAALWGMTPPLDAVLLGSLAGTHYWATAVDSLTLPTDPDALGGRVRSATIRVAGSMLSDNDAALATTAVALIGWHRRARYCTRCGAPMTPEPTGHSRRCPAGHQEFPRTDPAVIVRVDDGDGRVLLARQPSWDAGRFSVLAGFAEAGESLEATVVREIREEVGVTVSDVSYLGSQPWPFPRSLMVAFAARAPRGAILRPRPGEIDQAEWVSTDTLAALLRGVPVDGAVTSLPGPVSIARRMLESYLHDAS